MDRPAAGYRDIKPKTLWSIQYLRALSAMGVIVFHSLANTGHDFAFGAIGIHLFFVISGFLMWTTTCRDDADIGRFVASRVKRIIPLYWFATFLILTLSGLAPHFIYQATWNPVHVIKSLLFIPQIGVEGGVFPVLYQGWTLQYEMFFYAIFAVSLRFGLASRLWVLTAIIAPLSLIGLLYPNSGNPLFSTYTNPICMEFLAGAWAAKFCATRRLSPGLAGILLLSGMIGLWLSDHYEAYLDPLSWLATACTAAAIIIAVVTLEQHDRMPRIGWLKYGGEASYSLYLFQDAGFLLANRFARYWAVYAKSGAWCLGAVVVGIALFVLVEKPLQRLLKRDGAKASAR